MTPLKYVPCGQSHPDSQSAATIPTVDSNLHINIKFNYRVTCIISGLRFRSFVLVF